MDNNVENQERVPEDLNKLLAVAVRSIQWSYAIFWSLSIQQQGVLEWNKGYYNGDIKTRKTVQATEQKADRIGLQRSEQLRELYKSLLEGESDEESKRPTSLSPEDLTDLEWYYLVCMSFVFITGQGLPGRAFASGETIWLCDAHQADTKIFSRSLLAKSASIQTVICFPHLGGVIELGITKAVLEDHSLIQHVKASLLEFSKPVCSDKSSSHYDNENDGNDPICLKLNHEQADKIEELKSDPTVDDELEGTVDEDFTTDSSDSCSSNSTLSLYFKGENVKDQHLKEFQESCINLGTNEDLHYRKTLFSILQNSQPFIRNSYLRSRGLNSSFSSWKKGGRVDDGRKILQGSILKKILFNVPFKYDDNSSVKSQEEIGRKDLENEKFCLLRSMIPSINKIDKASILDDTIHYLKRLKSRIQALESCSDVSESGARTGPTFPDLVEHISDNYGSLPRIINKRKACEIDETNMDPHGSAAISKNVPPSDIKVDVNEHDVLIEMTCVSRENILVDIIEVVNNLDLDTRSVQSQILDGVVTLSLKSKVRGSAVASARMIKQELRKVARKC